MQTAKILMSMSHTDNTIKEIPYKLRRIIISFFTMNLQIIKFICILVGAEIISDSPGAPQDDAGPDNEEKYNTFLTSLC